MNTVMYNGRMTEEEIFRYAYHRMLEVDKEDLYKILLTVREEAWEEGYEEGEMQGYTNAMIEQREDEPEVKFDPLP